jgi:hypothetical protein
VKDNGGNLSIDRYKSCGLGDIGAEERINIRLSTSLFPHPWLDVRGGKFLEILVGFPLGLDLMTWSTIVCFLGLSRIYDLVKFPLHKDGTMYVVCCDP